MESISGTPSQPPRKVAKLASSEDVVVSASAKKKQKQNAAGRTTPSSSASVSSLSPTPNVLAGGGRHGADIGNYRMLIDDLSYLCSAIIRCRKMDEQVRRRGISINQGQGLTQGGVVCCEHTNITAGAACDISEFISHSDTRSTLLFGSADLNNLSRSTVGKKSVGGGAKVGALEAVLESIACAPSALDLLGICRELIDSHGGIRQVKCENQKVGGAKGSCNVNAWDDPSNEFVRNEVKNEGVLETSLAERGKYDLISSKALSIVSYFVGIDCTGSHRASIESKGSRNRRVVHLTRKRVLEHKTALRGIARLVADDPVVHAYLHDVINNSAAAAAPEKTSMKGKLIRNSSIGNHSTCSSTAGMAPLLHDFSEPVATKCMDPTKVGRRSRKKRKSRSSYSRETSPESNPEAMMSLSANLFQGNPLNQVHHPSELLSRLGKCPDESPSFLFCSPNEEGTSPTDGKVLKLHSGDRNEEKISLALSRAKLICLDSSCSLLPICDPPSTCSFCNIWEPNMISNTDPNNNTHQGFISSSSLALMAADCIITGRDKFSEEDNNDDNCDDEDDIFFGNDSNDQTIRGKMSRNPIVYANESLRRSGSLPYYSRAMSETMAAILISSNKKSRNVTNCSRCINYLRQRASSLSEVIDSLCCLSPKVSKALSLPESFLVPSLLRVIAEQTFSEEGNSSRPICEITSTALNTLTTLTHENSVACDQIIAPYPWKISLPTTCRGSASSQITGLDIIFSYLFHTATLKQGSKSAHNKSIYDNLVFCLNILTNIVEVVPNPTKRMISTLVINEGFPHSTSKETSGLSWLAQWLVSRTSGFQNSVMKGSFGSNTESRSSTADSNELKIGEEENLITSGNGFVLLAYLMMEDNSMSPSESIRDIILKELPIDGYGNSGGIQFMIKTLKAFCNFYHYSVGDLSVAVIAPVVKLIGGLEKIDMVD